MDFLKEKLEVLKVNYPMIISSIKGKGLLSGIELKIPTDTFCKLAREKKLLLVPAANNVVRILPPLNVKKIELEIAISVIEECLKEVKLTRNFLNLSDINKSQLMGILKRATDLKVQKKNKDPATLKNINLAMIFEKPSTRTRVSFELAIKGLGGESIILDEATTHLSRGETISDTARVLSKYCNILMIKTIITKSSLNIISIQNYL